MTKNYHTFNTSLTHFRRHKRMSKNKYSRALDAEGEETPIPSLTISSLRAGGLGAEGRGSRWRVIGAANGDEESAFVAH